MSKQEHHIDGLLYISLAPEDAYKNNKLRKSIVKVNKFQYDKLIDILSEKRKHSCFLFTSRIFANGRKFMIAET